jgi:hypothetical protein
VGVFARAQPHVVVAGRQLSAQVQHWQRRARDKQTQKCRSKAEQSGMGIAESELPKSHESDVTGVTVGQAV